MMADPFWDAHEVVMTMRNRERETLARDAFIARFKTRLRDLLGEHYDFKYVDQIAPTYWDDPSQRAEGPEECAEAEFGEWGEE